MRSLCGTGWGFAWRCEGDADDVPDNVAVMNEVDWSLLSHAFGAADDLPEILSALSPDPSSEPWGELWGRVCHQGTTYTASPYVLPRLFGVGGWVGAQVQSDADHACGQHCGIG